jgi:hypothetical protein
MILRSLLTPVVLGSFLALAACSAASADSVASANAADTASCATTNVSVATGFIDDLRGAMTEGAATDPNRVEILGGLKVARAIEGETISTVIGVGMTTNVGPDGLSGVQLGDLSLDGPLGIESGNAAKALYDAMKMDGVESKGTLMKRSGPLDCVKLEFEVHDVPPYKCTISGVTEVAHGFDGTGTTLTFPSGTIAAIRAALKPESVTTNGFAVSGSLSGTVQAGGGPDHITSVDGIETYIPAGSASSMTAHFGGLAFTGDPGALPGNAAEKVFSAMTRATETFVPVQRLTTRKSANGRIVCVRRVEKGTLYSCSLTGADWQTIAEGTAATPGFCSAP